MIELVHGDCMTVMEKIPDQSIDMIFADLPYGTTQNEFDKRLPLLDYVMVGGKPLDLESYLLHTYHEGVPYKDALAAFRKDAVPGLWTHYKRIIKKNGCIALFAQAPFDVMLADSNQSWYRYEWIIQKTRATGHLNARHAPMKAHEKLLIFYQNPPTYNPQMLEGCLPTHSGTKPNTGKANYKQTAEHSNRVSTERFPIDVLTFKWDTRTNALHRNQKPVSMCEYFIRTYTEPGDTVLDNCMGSCSAGVACIHTNRSFIGIEKKESIYLDAVSRMDDEIILKKEGVLPYVAGDQTIIQSVIEGF